MVPQKQRQIMRTTTNTEATFNEVMKTTFNHLNEAQRLLFDSVLDGSLEDNTLHQRVLAIMEEEVRELGS